MRLPKSFVAASIFIALLTMNIFVAHAGPVGSRLRHGFMIGSGDNAVSNAAAVYASGGRIVRVGIYIENGGIDYWINIIKSVLDYRDAQARDLVVVIDMHHPEPPAQNADPNHLPAPVTDVPAFIGKWKSIAAALRGRDESYVWAELLNEPSYSYPGYSWEQLAAKTANAIRAIDPQRIIVYGKPTSVTAGINGFRPLPNLSNQIVTVHFWDWQTTTTNPHDLQWQDGSAVVYGAGSRTKAVLRSRLMDVQAFAKKYGVTVYIGEVGINCNSQYAAPFLKDFTDLCDELGFPLTIHAFRESTVWWYEGTPAWPVLTSWLGRYR